MKYKKIIRRVNNQSVEAFEPIEYSSITKIFIGMIIIGFLFLIVKASIIYGVGKEREENSKICVDSLEMEKYKETLTLATEVCIKIQQQQMSSLNYYCNQNLKTAQDETSKWKNLYSLKLKEISATTSSSTQEIIN
jgi:ABC-type lipoprotein release transport system permease subunit